MQAQPYADTEGRRTDYTMKLNLDDWQKKFIETEGDKILLTGRQVGKSVICGIDAGEWGIKQTKPTDILMIAPTERQAYALFEKTLGYMLDTYPKQICTDSKRKATKTKFELKNGIRYWCLPVGLSGLGIRFLTIGRLYADEASRIPQDVWAAVSPMLLTTAGAKVYLSTGWGNEGEFADAWNNLRGAYNSFTRFTISSEKCVRERVISETWTIQQRDKALEFLAQEKAKMSKLEYAQEYEGILLDEIRQFFPTMLIKRCMEIDRDNQVLQQLPHHGKLRALGTDIARMGGDETAHIGLETGTCMHNYFQIYQENRQNTRLTEVAREMIDLDRAKEFNRIFIDDGGLGSGVVDMLLESRCRRKVRAINNATWIYSNDKQHKKIMKEHLYNNLLSLMEQGKMHLYKDNDLFESLHSIQAEYHDGKMRIFGKYSHLTEALVRAAWINREKGLNLWIA